MTGSEEMRIALRARRDALPRINWWAVAAVVAAAFTVAVLGGGL